MKAREGDLVQTREAVIFDVKGLVHPPDRIVAFIRYFADERGERRNSGTAYSKVYPLPDRYALLKQRFPRYLVHDKVFDETLCEVPAKEVKKHFVPINALRALRKSADLDKLQAKALLLAEKIKEDAKISWTCVGISGSLLVDLHTPKSDIDIIVYGSSSCLKVHEAVESMLRDGASGLDRYNEQQLKSLFEFRSKDTRVSFEEFVRTESRKSIQGRFMETDFFMRFVKDWDENTEKYGDVLYKNNGYACIEAVVADASESIFTPCRYRLRKVRSLQGKEVLDLKEIVSFRGRFCEQAKNGETVVAQGKVERVTNVRQNEMHSRLLIGNKPSDFMILKKT